jgi:integrase
VEYALVFFVWVRTGEELMPRTRKDGSPSAPPRKTKLNEMTVTRSRPADRPYLIWDVKQKGLAVAVHPTGSRSYKTIYSKRGRPRWITLGKVGAIGLADARLLAQEIMLEVARGKDPAADRRAERNRGTFAEVAERYVETYAKKHNKSWAQPAALVRRFLLPRWGKLPAHTISRADVKALIGRISAPIVANQTLAAASAIFAWAIGEEIVTTNPCRGVNRNKTNKRERILSESELPKFWAAFDGAGLVASSALKTILLTGQRPGEVAHMRWSDIRDGWWTLPGEPEKDARVAFWPGTKNGATHRVWLAKAAAAIIEELNLEATSKLGYVFASARGNAIDLDRTMPKFEGVERATPHDLRRTHGSTVTALNFGRDAMNRIQNHKEGGIADVYDRHEYAEENKRIMEAVAARIVALATGAAPADNVVAFSPVRGEA